MMTRVFVSDMSQAFGRGIAAYLQRNGRAVSGIMPDAAAAPEGIRVYRGDFLGDADCGALAQQVLASGGIDVLVLTGREIPRTSIEDASIEALCHAMNYNVKRAFFLVKHLGGLMGAKGKGAIVFVGSIHSEKPTGASLAYSCSMGALKMLCSESALQMGRKGVHCVYIETGPIEGDDEVFDSEISPIYDGYTLSIPRKKPITLSEIGQAVIAAAEMPALNGSEIRLDGGFTLKYGDR